MDWSFNKHWFQKSKFMVKLVLEKKEAWGVIGHLKKFFKNTTFLTNSLKKFCSSLLSSWYLLAIQKIASSFKYLKYLLKKKLHLWLFLFWKKFLNITWAVLYLKKKSDSACPRTKNVYKTLLCGPFGPLQKLLKKNPRLWPYRSLIKFTFMARSFLEKYF